MCRGKLLHTIICSPKPLSSQKGITLLVNAILDRYFINQAMFITTLACAALFEVTISTPASAQVINFPWTKRHHHLQRDALRVQIRKLQSAPSPAPSEGTTPAPSEGSTPAPSEGSTPAPSEGLTSEPTEGSTSEPTEHPSPEPTESPTPQSQPPTSKPTHPAPTTSGPTVTPGNPTQLPTAATPTEEPTKKPTMIPTEEPTKKPTRKPTRKPTIKPTRKPTRKPTNKASYTRNLYNCALFYDKVIVERDGSNFTFKWNGTYGSCVDYADLHYEYGEFYNVETFADCAEACVQDVDEELTNRTVFRGIDYVCESEKDGYYYYEGKCRCLYDNGTLDSKFKAIEKTDFDKTNHYGDGIGPVNGTSTEEERTSIGDTLTTLCGAIVDHFDEGPEVEHFSEVAYY